MVGKIVIELTPEVAAYPHKEHPRIGFPSHIQYSDGSISYGVMDIEQIKSRFDAITNELETILKKAHDDYWEDILHNLQGDVDDR